MSDADELEVAPNQPEPWTRVHRRVWERPGAIVDLGCLTWNWSQRFIGKKRVIGVDPFETMMPVGTELWNGVIAATSGTVRLTDNGHGSTTRYALTQPFSGTRLVESVPLEVLLARAEVTDISVLKLNVEGSEPEILMTMPECLFDHIDQIAVSFHDFLHGHHRQTEAVLVYLCNWYKIVPLLASHSWYLALKR